MHRVGEENALFISAANKENFEEFRERVLRSRETNSHHALSLQQVFVSRLQGCRGKEEKEIIFPKI